jgi:hypothetical protein
MPHLHERTAIAKLQLNGVLHPVLCVAGFHEVVDVLFTKGEKKDEVL